MDLKDFSKLDELSSPLAVLAKGPQILAQWQENRTQKRYEDFIRAALQAEVLPENADAMTPDDLFAMLKALELDMESEKAPLYGRLACSIATGKVTGHLKRHFIKALSELSFGQADLLRRARIVAHHDVFPGAGAGRRKPEEFLGLDSKNSLNRLTFERLGMLEQKGLSRVGIQFVEACFTSDELEPSAAGFRVWADGIICIVCNELGTPSCAAFLHHLTEEGHRDAIRVVNGAAIRGRLRRPLFAGPVLAVLLTQDPLRLIEAWPAVEESIRGRALTVVATTDPSAALPAPLDGFAHIDSSPDRVSAAVQDVLSLFKRHGLAGVAPIQRG